ncbi:MAG: hypothetical protein RQ966_07210 [Acetobacteraceae bacterium]|nr:hypothetical protein [Acetobacteraceae bacterium]
MRPLAAHADWSIAAAKRWMSVATPAACGWTVSAEPVGDLDTLLPRLRARASGAPVALGVDAPIGLPASYPHSTPDFPSFLAGLAATDPLFSVAEAASDISLARPFYPRRAHSGARRRDLLDALGLADGEQLLRQCERRSGAQPAASPLFWTLGANQVGKGAICLWRDLLLPALQAPTPPRLWPFAGSLESLLVPGGTVIAECYPADAARRMGLGLKGSKRRQSDRMAVAPTLRALLESYEAWPDAAMLASIDAGFGYRTDGEDPFDSLIGLIRMLQIIREPALDELPEPPVRQWEGWILGRPLSSC